MSGLQDPREIDAPVYLTSHAARKPPARLQSGTLHHNCAPAAESPNCLLVHQRCTSRRTVVIAVDFSKAFDTINHTALLGSIHESSMDANTVRWLCTYLRGRTASCIYNRGESNRVIIHQGVPQGSILSRTLFNACVSCYPHTADLCTSYADDFTASASHPDVEEAAATMANHAKAPRHGLQRKICRSPRRSPQ